VAAATAPSKRRKASVGLRRDIKPADIPLPPSASILSLSLWPFVSLLLLAIADTISAERLYRDRDRPAVAFGTFARRNQGDGAPSKGEPKAPLGGTSDMITGRAESESRIEETRPRASERTISARVISVFGVLAALRVSTTAATSVRSNGPIDGKTDTGCRVILRRQSRGRAIRKCLSNGAAE